MTTLSFDVEVSSISAVFREYFECFRVGAKIGNAIFFAPQPTLTPVLGRTALAASVYFIHEGFHIAARHKCRIKSMGLEHRSHSAFRVRRQVFSVCKDQGDSHARHYYGGNYLHQ